MSDLDTSDGVGGQNKGSPCWNYITYPTNGWWTRFECNKKFTMTWFAPFWWGGGGSLETWAEATTSCKLEEWVDLEPTIVGRSGGSIFGKLKIQVYLLSKWIENRGYMVWYQEIWFTRMRSFDSVNREMSIQSWKIWESDVDSHIWHHCSAREPKMFENWRLRNATVDLSFRCGDRGLPTRLTLQISSQYVSKMIEWSLYLNCTWKIMCFLFI